jgi:hypothetical protein
VIAASAEARDFAGGVEAGDRLAGRVQHLRIKVGVQAAQSLAGQDVQANRDQGAVLGIEYPVRLCRADQPVAEIVARAMDGGDLRVLGERILHLAVARLDLLQKPVVVDQVFAGQLIHAGDELTQIAFDYEILAIFLERFDRRRRAGAAPTLQHRAP